ncbi:hypothetical protein [Cryptosporangium sp. NPDC048952]|uniref:hypothetical protein n=1 Tax=Cryptosporangium sp. NPDC048952 TaxID=3363961 RepID=UPI003715E721
MIPATLVAILALVVGGMADTLGDQSDQGSPLTTSDIGVSGAGAVAVLVLATWWLTRKQRPYKDDRSLMPVALATVVALAICTVPLWKRYNMIDVTASGFHRAAYTFSGAFRVWNGTDQRLRVCVGATGTCVEGRPVLLLDPGQRGSVENTYRVGRHSLTIVEPGPWARRDTRVTIEEVESDDDPYTPGAPTQPYVPPPYLPPQAPMVPYR